MAGAGGGPSASDSSSMLAGAAAGFIATALLHPLDLVKTRQHVQEKDRRRLPQYRGVSGACRTIWEMEGIAGFYQGVTSNLLGSTLSWALYMGVDRKIQPGSKSS